MSKYQCKSCGGFCGKSRCERLPIPIEHIRFPYLDAKQKLIRIMGTFDLATGHANTFDELLDSLESELRDVLGHYRDKPEPKPDVEKFFILEANPILGLRLNEIAGFKKQPHEDWIRVVFDGETAKMKSAEVLK